MNKAGKKNSQHTEECALIMNTVKSFYSGHSRELTKVSSFERFIHSENRSGRPESI